MTPAQRALILAALGLTPRDGVMPRWSSRNRYDVRHLSEEPWPDLVSAGWAHGTLCRTLRQPDAAYYHVTRRGAEAAGVLGRCRRGEVDR